MARKTLQQRFEEKVDRSGGTTSCHEWTASQVGNGYGRFVVGGRKTRAHRLAYELSVGPIPAGLCVLHRCDNPTCVNPLHLFLGTQVDNVADMVAKSRQDKRLTEDQAREIRALAGTKSRRELGNMFGVDHTTINAIVWGETWKPAMREEEG